MNTLSRTWNIIQGKKNGIELLIVDTTLQMGGRQGRVATFIAARTDQDIFRDKQSQEKIAQSNGWTALYRFRFWQTPWTLSIQRIEEYLNSLDN